MPVLVGYASLHWSTKGIAQQIGDRLMKAGFKAVVRPMSELDSVLQYEAVVLGSAVYDRVWLPPGTQFLTRHAGELARRRVWLFNVSAVKNNNPSDGPARSQLTGDTLAQCEEARRAGKQAYFAARQVIQPRDHHDFTAVTERGEWRRVSDLLLKVCGGYRDDRRSWRDINAWADGIARVLQTSDQVKERRRLHLMVRGRP